MPLILEAKWEQSTTVNKGLQFQEVQKQTPEES